MRTFNVSRRAFLTGAGTVLASLTVPLAGTTTQAFAELTSSDEATQEKIVIIGTNDVHGSLENPVTKLGYAALADYAATQREKHGSDHVTIVDAGDIVQGNPTASLTQGAIPAQAVAACGYDVIVPGNHEFDYGIDRLRELADIEGAAYTCCNLTDMDGACVFEPYHIVEYPTDAAPIRVAYVGVTTPTTRGNSATFKNDAGEFIYDFAIDETGEQLRSAVQTAVDDARDSGEADYVVLLAHLGQSWSPQIWRSDTLVAQTNGIDAVIDAHTHQAYVQTVKNKDGDEIPVVQAGCKFLGFSTILIDPSARTATASVVATGVEGELIDLWDGLDRDVSTRMAELDAQVDELAGEVVGSSEVDLVALAADGSQATWLGETNLGDLIADAILDAAKRAGVDCDIALYDGFGICADIASGTVTRRHILAALACNRQIYALEVSGQHLLNVLEVACALLPEPEARLLQISDGFSYTVRTDIKTPLVVSPSTIGFVGIEGERRVKDAKLNGKDVDPDGRYTIAMPKGMLAGGGWSMPVPENAEAATMIGLDNECLLTYVQETLEGTIGEQYADAQGAGRISVAGGEDGGSEDTTAAEAEDTSDATPILAAAGVGAAAIAAAAVAVKRAQSGRTEHSEKPEP